ncbi:HDOD domain-containing protein [Vibrio barjaei]|jgi:HD-like signal output (HDOD) protein|uniref:HDOD domain-containing protein n=1 Tax=Vibrio barjaei TaxID=1676683 RepID=A0ABW7IIL8_9VIBR|nr:HDOD domain-containing protein [Vibrio barjaei]MCG9787223.1 HDOD domain-containing protein [Vibrio mediterranei]MCY9874569.1 HDOD domain-containing protein [Vibrio barjaei]OIN25623.1 histidine kinase [Vibrio barjaei]
MNHLSFYWLPDNQQLFIESLETEFAELVEQSINTGKISLPPISEVVLKIQKLCTLESTGISDIANCLLEDPGLAAIVLKVANSVIFNRGNVTCKDLNTAVSRLGILRVRDIVTAQSIELLKHSVNLTEECKDVLVQSAAVSRELAATMVMVTQAFQYQSPTTYQYLEQEKALLVGFLADIGLFCLVNEYHLYLEKGNYLDSNLAMQIFHSRCPITSEQVLKTWGFDNDFIEVASNQPKSLERPEVSYLDIARIANHVLLYRKQDHEALEEHEVEINVDGAEVLYKLTTMSDQDFRTKTSEIIRSAGM